MEIKITFDDGLAGYQFIDGEGKTLNYEDMTRQEQIHICNCFAQGYNLFSKFIKEE